MSGYGPLLAFCAMACCTAAQNTAVYVEPPWAHELLGYRIYGVSKLRAVAPLGSTMADVRRVLGEPDQARDMSRPTQPYPGDGSARQPVLTYRFGPDWEMLAYSTKWCSYAYPPMPVGDRLCSVELIPRSPRSLSAVVFPPAFQRRHVATADGAWDEYSTDSGLRYEVYTTSAQNRLQRPGDLRRIVYGPPRGPVPYGASHDWSCGDCSLQEPACARAWEPYTHAMFLGTVLDVTGEPTLGTRVTATVQIDEAFRGVSGKTATVATGGNNCGFPFSKGRQYVVYARRDAKGLLDVDLCCGTDWADRATADLGYLRKLPPASEGGVVYGQVLRLVFDPDKLSDKAARVGKGVKGQRVLIRGDKTYATETDAAGYFRLADLEPGGYEVSIDVPSRVDPNPSQFVRIFGAGCAQADFWIDPFEPTAPARQAPASPH